MTSTRLAVIDTGPSRDLLHHLVYQAADEVIIPTTVDYLGLVGVAQQFDSLRALRSGGWSLEVLVPPAALGLSGFTAGQQLPFTWGLWDDDEYADACHRSGNSGQARAVKTMRQEFKGLAIAFKNVACSGAEVIEGLLTPQLKKSWLDTTAHFTNAATLVSRDYKDTEDLGGVFSGLSADGKKYDNASWAYQRNPPPVSPPGKPATTASSCPTPRGRATRRFPPS